MSGNERQLNQDAYRCLKETIKTTYPPGRFVAIAGGEIVGDAADFMNLYSALQAAGRNPAEVMIVQAGHDYVEKAEILSAR